MSTPSQSVPIAPPRRNWFRHFVPHRFHEGVVELGFLTSWIFTILVLLVPLFGDYLHPLHKWIGTLYLAFQLAEILARNSLKNTLVLADHAFSVAPALVGLVYTVMYWSPLSLSAASREVLNYWHFIAWLDFAFGIAIANKILGVPYEREESQSDT